MRRVGGTETYKKAVNGELGGIDLKGSSIVKFLNEVVTELMVMGRVGIMVDMFKLEVTTRADLTNDMHPYCYIVKCEDIFSYYFESGKLKSLLVRIFTYKMDEETGLPKEVVPEYLLFNTSTVTKYDASGAQIDQIALNIDEIPFILPEISCSLLKDVSNYQIALLNLASSDMNFALKANFPFYTEQFDPRSEIAERLRKSDDGKKSEDGGKNDIEIGGLHGRRYAMNLDRPEFIAPPAHPLEISMKKQNQMKEEIRQLVHLALASLRPKMVSAEAISMESEGLESGLAYLGLTLEFIERRIAELWNKYESNNQEVIISYPKRYALKSDKERLMEANERFKIIDKIPSSKFKKESVKDIATMLLGSKVKSEIMDEILSEIDNASVTNIEPETILKSVENALLSNETASTLLGYPEGEAEKAAKDHADRIARIKEAQSNDNSASRGDRFNSANPKSGKQEKILKKVMQ